MTPESDPYKVTTPYGVLYLAVMPATFENFWRGDTYVIEPRPRIRVATDPAFEADPAAEDHWVIKGRAWAVHRTFYFEDLSHLVCANGTPGNRWHMENSPHKGGYRNAKRQTVEINTPTWKLIDAAVIAALDTFAADNPEWPHFSEYLYWNGKEDAARAEARDLERQAREQLVKAAGYQEKAAAAQAVRLEAYRRHALASEES